MGDNGPGGVFPADPPQGVGGSIWAAPGLPGSPSLGPLPWLPSGTLHVAA